MSQIVKELTLARLQQMVRETGTKGLPVKAIKDIPASLTKGRVYLVRITSAGELIFHDDFDIPVYLNTAEDWDRFEPLVDAGEVEDEIVDHRSRLEHRVRELLGGLSKVDISGTRLEPGDIIVRKDPIDGTMDDRPYVVAKILSREEQRMVAQVCQTLMSHDVVAYHNYNGPTASVLPSYCAERIGSLREWGLPDLDPNLIEHLTVFDKISTRQKD